LSAGSASKCDDGVETKCVSSLFLLISSKQSLIYRSVGIFGVNGFVAVDTTNRRIVVSFQGTQTVPQVAGLIPIGQIPVNLCSGCQSHSGFIQSWNDVRIAVIAAVQEANSTFNSAGNWRVVSAGHSLGAAIATHAALELRNNKFIVDLVS
jgi:hypothetical protein